MKNDLKKMLRNAENVTGMLKSLANESRLMILCILDEQELSVNELNEQIGLSQSALSQHLAKLREDNLVKTRRDSQTIYYSLVSIEVKKIIQLLYKLYC